MAEKYTLATPETTPAVVNNEYEVRMLHFDWEDGLIRVRLHGQNGETINTGYGGSKEDPNVTDEQRADAIKMMRTLNTANLSTKSLHKRVVEKLSADGKIPPGTMTGTPDPVT